MCRASVRRGSFAAIGWENAMSATALETGPVQAFGVMATPSGEARENVPFARRPGSLTVKDASPAVETIVAEEDAV